MANGKGSGEQGERRQVELQGRLDALDKAMATIEFEVDGTVVAANDLFLRTMGYRREEVVGQHHRLFIDPAYARGAEYQDFWARLGRGEFQRAEYKRLGKGGREVWLQATYNPILDGEGRVLKVVKYATDVTQQKLKSVEYEGQVAAVARAMATIEFALDGTIRAANDLFLRAMGYRLDEVQGQHHRMFVSDEAARSHEYREFWARLNRGEFQQAEYKRLGKGGREVWLQATYNPILDIEGRPTKVIKYAIDITDQKVQSAEAMGQIKAIDKSMAVIHFRLDGTIIDANQRFLNAIGYSQSEIRGQHHRMFVEDSVARGSEYREFWARLNRGEFQQGEFRRLGKNGRAVWLQATYNPIQDAEGNWNRVVKYATDVTEQVQARDMIDASSRSLAAASEQLHSVSQRMASNAEELSNQASQVSSAAQQVTANVTQVSTGVEEMNSSIREIARSSSEAARVASDAVSLAEGANHTVVTLGQSSNEIGNVIRVITSIAQQTKLLALNATIEAARAGEAGKGFAVVANEVKELAKETAKATEDIGQRIEAIQSDARGAIEAIQRIVEIIGRINDHQNTIASAVEEQSTTSGEVARNLGEAVKGMDEISRNIAGVATVATETSSGANDNLSSAKELASLAEELRTQVQAFAYSQ